MKVCTVCGEEQEETSSFYKRTNGRYHASCKKCQLEHKKIYYQNNDELLKQKRRNHYKNNKKACRASESKYRKKRRKSEPQFRLREVVRGHIRRLMLGVGKKVSSIKYLGCSIDELKLHLESLFKPGMTWENYGKNGWHIDHIFPLSKVDLTNEAECYRVLNYKNLRPLWAEDNLRKRDHLL